MGTLSFGSKLCCLTVYILKTVLSIYFLLVSAICQVQFNTIKFLLLGWVGAFLRCSMIVVHHTVQK